MSGLIKIFLVFALINYTTSPKDDTTKNVHNTKEVKPMITIQEVQKKYMDTLMSLPGVEGIGIGKKGRKDCLIVFISKISKENKQKIPQVLDGFSVKLVKTGQFKALPKK